MEVGETDSDNDKDVLAKSLFSAQGFLSGSFCNTQTDSLILCDYKENPPGFTLLWLPLERAAFDIIEVYVIL